MKVPVDHELFNNINRAQWAWYQVQVLLDEKDEWETLRDVAEHNAFFMNPEMVRKVKEDREHTYELSDESFDSILKENFGRALPNTEEHQGTGKASRYLNMELDEISFTPY